VFTSGILGKLHKVSPPTPESFLVEGSTLLAFEIGERVSGALGADEASPGHQPKTEVHV
jgi:hypothetical protein